MIVSLNNPLLGTDVYKMGHMEQYAPKTTKVYSYLVTRSDKTYSNVVFDSLEYYLQAYLSKRLTKKMGEEFLKYRELILGSNSKAVKKKIRALCKLGYFPLEIKAVKEGSIVGVRNVLLTITNTLPEFYWVVGFVESLLLKIWSPISTASCSLAYKLVAHKMFLKTCDESTSDFLKFAVHDFGYRGDQSEESAQLTGAAHLLAFRGSDTVVALPFLANIYRADLSTLVMASIPASEHSVMCSFGRENELAAFEHMLETYPTGPVSIVSDTFDVYTVLTEFAEKLKDRILARDGKVVFRPDSGNPEYIICGDPNAPEGSPEWLGAVRLLDKTFGHTVNKKGYKVLNNKVGLIYGDGMYLERYARTLDTLEKMGYASSNLVIGVGGILRNHTRDTLGFAIKATYVIVDEEEREIEKDPITDTKKKSHKGLIQLKQEAYTYTTLDQQTKEQEQEGALELRFFNGNVFNSPTFTEKLNNYNAHYNALFYN